MSDVIDNLLVQYYGFSERPKVEKFLSIHECISDVKNNENITLGEQSTIDTDGDNKSEETEVEGINNENEIKNLDDDTFPRSSRVLLQETLENDDETSLFDIIFETNTDGNLFENISTNSDKEIQDIALEDTDKNDTYLSFGDDISPDTTSDASSIMGKKNPMISSDTCIIPLTQSSIRTPTYNETFVDLTCTKLTSFPISMIEKYSMIQMLYLENNSLSELPDKLFTFLSQLQWLDVRNNLLTSLPASIKSHPSLETILIQENKIEQLPLELCTISQLKILNVAHNPLVMPPKDIVALGCSNILNYLRIEWNKLHPDEPVTFIEEKIEPKPSTILCYQPPREKPRKLSKILRRASKSTSDVNDLLRGFSVRKRSRTYKPSNRCNGKGTNIAMEQRVDWISKTKELLNVQSTIIQKMKDADAVKEWRHNKCSFKKSMDKASKRNEDDIPFAIDIEDYPAIRKQSAKMEKYLDNQKRQKLKFNPPANINQKIQQLLSSLQEIEITKPELYTPKTKQKQLQNDISKLSYFQNEIQCLRRYNEMVVPANCLNNTNIRINKT